MALDKLVDSSQLDADLTTVANAIRTKGGTSAQLAFPQGMADAIAAIPSGGGNPVAEENDVIFIDFDGTIRYSYSREEFLALTELPPNPTHEGLTAQGWGWTLDKAQSYVNKYDALEIGQSYIPTDGGTHIGFSLAGKTTIVVQLALASGATASIDWGDGDTDDFDNTITTQQTLQHTYQSTGNYEIAIHNSGQITFAVKSTTVYGMFSGQNPNSLDSAVKYIYLGNNVARGAKGFAATFRCPIVYNCNSVNTGNAMLASVNVNGFVMPKYIKARFGNSNWFQDAASAKYIAYPEDFAYKSGANTLGVVANYNYSSCYRLSRISPDEVNTNWADSAFQNCRSLQRINVPACVENIGANTFSGCTGLQFMRFYGTTPPAVANANAFNNLPTSCKIFVPRGCLTAYTTATNYPDSTNYTYEEFDLPT